MTIQKLKINSESKLQKNKRENNDDNINSNIKKIKSNEFKIQKTEEKYKKTLTKNDKENHSRNISDKFEIKNSIEKPNWIEFKKQKKRT